MKIGKDMEWIEELPSSLRKSIESRAAVAAMSRIPAFKHIDYRAAFSISEKLRVEVFVPGQEICWYEDKSGNE
jgi:hypothetical protein